MLNGVGDYSFVLATVLRKRFDILTHFAVCSPAWHGADEVEGFPVTALPQRHAPSFAARLDDICRRQGVRVLVLQLSPYGFDANGAPLWLSRALRAWKRASAGRSSITYFHELFASSAPWRKGFWLSPIQRLASARVARSSDALVTNRAQSARLLARVAGVPASRVGVLPVLSGIGESEQPDGNRAPRLVVWAGGAARAVLYRRYRALLADLVDRLGIQRIADIGTPSADIPHAIGKAVLDVMGIAPAAQIRDMLQTSAIGVVHYPPQLLGKSSIFAAFAAHALPALVLDAGEAPVELGDGLTRATHLLTRQDMVSASPGSLPSIGQAARRWYAGHDAQSHAAHIARAVDSLDPEGST